MSEKTLIIYYSHSGNTKKLAEAIAQKTGGVLCEIKPQAAYPKEYNLVVEQAKKEIRNDYRPALKTNVDNIKTYDTVFIGTPNWWSTMAPPVASFLGFNDLKGKTIAPFFTHGGGGAGNIERDIAKLCPDSKVLPGLAVSGSRVDDAKINEWLEKIGIN